MPSQYPMIAPDMLTGGENVHHAGKPVGLSLLDFWRWQGSNLLDNSMRGVLAEFYVTAALDCKKTPRVEWDGYDCLTREGIKVEVKSSAYIQSWDQSKLSKIQFDIAPKMAWKAKTNTYSSKPKRSADVYVFCVHTHKDQETISPLDLSQWEFYVLSTKRLDAKAPHQKSISLNALIKRFSPAKPTYKELRKEIYKANGRTQKALFTIS